MKIIQKALIIFLIFLHSLSANAQSDTGKIIIDQVAAVIGNNVILFSDIENEYIQALLQGNTTGSIIKCGILEEIMFQKLLLTQADIDSITVTDKQVDSEIDRRIRYFISQVGTQEKLEQYFNKTILEIKEDLRDKIRDYLLIQNVQSKLTQDVKITPSDVTDFFNSIPPDSLPLIGSQIEIAQIVKKPVISETEVLAVKDKLKALRDRILKGEDFAVMANLYSEDPGSNRKGGELGFVGRGEFFPEFESAAFSLKPGEISPIIKTKKGFHIIQMIERRGEYINVRHILMSPKANPSEMTKSLQELNRIAELIKKDSVTFEKAAILYSDDPSKLNGGKLTNPYTGDTKFAPEEIDPLIYLAVEKMNVGEMSAPTIFTDEEGVQAYRIIMLKSRMDPHTANLKDDYPQIQNLALQVKQNDAINKWVMEKTKNTYIYIADIYNDCKLKFDWITNE
ncbi:MAG: peptidylprolyl isomerase [Bacteroidales bacterium]|jgi:peptidyl-prolyl cis-trans isomerase SurA|nr:peptidylprolyl isomerase [Bacteroidales bacterium]MDD4213343.1 peptidylprolyl isomerase [Bacteroidales bacterium]